MAGSVPFEAVCWLRSNRSCKLDGVLQSRSIQKLERGEYSVFQRTYGLLGATVIVLLKTKTWLAVLRNVL